MCRRSRVTVGSYAKSQTRRHRSRGHKKVMKLAKGLYGPRSSTIVGQTGVIAAANMPISRPPQPSVSVARCEHIRINAAERNMRVHSLLSPPQRRRVDVDRRVLAILRCTEGCLRVFSRNRPKARLQHRTNDRTSRLRMRQVGSAPPKDDLIRGRARTCNFPLF